jgi:choline dehydrogenase-like flavoprotein
MQRDVRNIGCGGLAAAAIAAADTALGDLKARVLNVPLMSLFGRARHAVPIYGSGGFTTCDADCHTWDIRNLWICDDSVFCTVGGVNPSLTIQTIACRTADRIKALAASGEL